MRITQQKYNFIIYLYKMIIQKIIKNTIDNPKIQSDFLDDISKIRIKKFITTSINKKKLKFISQNGGDIKNIMINNNEYFYNIETAIANDDNNEEYILNLITIDGYSGCGTILYNVKNKKAIITSVSNIKECIFTKNLDIKYKVGDILMQILIYKCKKLKMKSIELTDNSNYPFTGGGIKLSLFRTITKGEPYYSKFGFKNKYEPEIIENNKKIFRENPKLNVNQLLKIIEQNIDKKNKYYNDAIIILNKISNKVQNNIIHIGAFANYIFVKALGEEKIIENIRQENIKNTKNNVLLINKYSYILNKIMTSLYIKSGYKILNSEKYILKFYKNNTNLLSGNNL